MPTLDLPPNTPEFVWPRMKDWLYKLWRAVRNISSTGDGNTTILGPLSIGSGGPTFTSGAGAPTSTQPNASIYLRTDGVTGARVYVSAGGGIWTAISGV